MSVNCPKYPKAVIKNIAQEIDIGMICFLNTGTMEFDSVLGESYDVYWGGDHADIYQEVCDKVDSWEHSVRIEPPESRQSFQIMELFIENCIPDNDAIKRRLWNAIFGRKPFQSFKCIIDDSKYRQRCFDFKQSQLEQFVLEQLPE